MAATKQDIHNWLRRALREKCTHMMVICDTYDHDDYPVFIRPGDNFWLEYENRNGKNMQKIMEVYDMSLPIEDQLEEHRANHCPPRKRTLAQ